MKNKKMWRRILLALVVVLIAAVIVVPVLASMMWEQEWDHRSVLFELNSGAGYNARSEGHSGWIGLGDIESVELDETISCTGFENVRVTLFAEADEDVRIRAACAIMTPTLAPTMSP